MIDSRQRVLSISYLLLAIELSAIARAYGECRSSPNARKNRKRETPDSRIKAFIDFGAAECL
jgi:hypothetical protein